MHTTRSLRPIDLVALVTLDGRVYPNEARPFERIGLPPATPNPLEHALEWALPFASNRRSWMALDGQTLRGIASARRRGAGLWEVDLLIAASENPATVAMRLDGPLLQAALQSRVGRVMVRVDAESPLAAALTTCGYVRAAAETLWVRAKDLPCAQATSALDWRLSTDADRYSCYQLYLAATPEETRRLEALSYDEWNSLERTRPLGRRGREWIAEREGVAVARLGVADRGRARLLDLAARAEAADDLPGLVARALSGGMAGSGELLALAQEYAPHVARALVCLGFEPLAHYVRLVRRLTVTVSALRPAPVKRGQKRPIMGVR